MLIYLPRNNGAVSGGARLLLDCAVSMLARLLVVYLDTAEPAILTLCEVEAHISQSMAITHVLTVHSSNKVV